MEIIRNEKPWEAQFLTLYLEKLELLNKKERDVIMNYFELATNPPLVIKQEVKIE